MHFFFLRKIQDTKDKYHKVYALKHPPVFDKIDRQYGIWKTAKPLNGMQYIRKSEPCRKTYQDADFYGKNGDKYAEESNKHDKRNDWYYGEIGDWRNKGNLSEIHHDDRKSEGHGSKTHREGFPDSKPLRKKRKHSSEKVPKKQESKYRQE